MIKIKKLTPEQLQEGITFNDYKKIARPLINATKKAHKGADNQVDFFILTDFEFSDRPGKKTTIFVPGKQDNNWKKYLKDKFKENKKNVMIGKCYISGEAGNEALNLIPQKGTAKMAIIKKQGKRMFAMVKLAVQLASGAEEATNASGGRVQQPRPEELQEQEETGSSSTDTQETSSSGGIKEQLKSQLKDLAQKLGGVKTGFSKVKAVVAKYKKKEISAADEQELAKVVDQLKAFVDALKGSHQKVQERMKEAQQKVIAQMPKIEALYKKLQTELQQKESKDSTTSSTELAPEVVAELQQQMTQAKTIIDQLKKELDLDAILADLAQA